MTDEEDRERASVHEDRMSKRQSEGMKGGIERVHDRLDKKNKRNDAVKEWLHRQTYSNTPE